MFLTNEQLIKILEEAFDGGWYGTKELKDSIIDELMNKAKKLQSNTYATYRSRPVCGSNMSDFSEMVATQNLPVDVAADSTNITTLDPLGQSNPIHYGSDWVIPSASVSSVVGT